MFKVPHLRNAYTKIGMFGRPSDDPRGPQIRGYGFLHDGTGSALYGHDPDAAAAVAHQLRERIVLAGDQKVVVTPAPAAATTSR